MARLMEGNEGAAEPMSSSADEALLQGVRAALQAVIGDPLLSPAAKLKRLEELLGQEDELKKAIDAASGTGGLPPVLAGDE